MAFRQRDFDRSLSAVSRVLHDLGTAIRPPVVGIDALASATAARWPRLTFEALSVADPGRSVLGFARLVHLEQAARMDMPFGGAVGELYDEELGEPVEADEQDGVTDRRARLAEAGFDTELTAFAEGRQLEVVAAAGFTFRTLEGVAIGTAGEERLSYDRRAGDLVGRVEFEVRQFVAARMAGRFGPQWLKHRVPGDMRRHWTERRDDAVASGQREFDLIFYADFMDLPHIICRKDNWAELFAPLLGAKEDVQTAFRRMHPIRIAVAHVRPVAAEEITLLAAEACRLLRAMGVRP